jgi:hypothetical protein
MQSLKANHSHQSTTRSGWSLTLLGTSLLALTVACNDTVTPTIITSNPGSVIVNPSNGRRVIVDESRGGLTPDLRMTRISWGRLVDVFAFMPNGDKVLTNVDLLIDPSIQSTLGYELNTTTLTGRDQLTIFNTLDGGSSEAIFNTLLRQLSEGLEPVSDVGFATSNGSFTAIPRNSALQITFNDLLDPTTINERSLRVLVGAPATIPFESRIIIDPNHGDVLDTNHDGSLAFHSTRVVIDLAISEVESFSADPPLAPNAIGLPASVSAIVSNFQLRIPTVVDLLLGQDVLVSNLSAHTIQAAGAGTVDFSDSVTPIMRNARSGGSEGLTGDAYNGFLIDNTSPKIVGVFDGAIVQAPQQLALPTQFFIPVVRFDSQNCAQQLFEGDLLIQGAVVAHVAAPSSTPSGREITAVQVELIQWPPAWGDDPSEWLTSSVQPLKMHSAWDPTQDAGKESCFITLRPNSLGAPENPTSQALVSTKISVRFSEPMAGDTMEAYEGLQMTRAPVDQNDAFGSHDWVVGQIQANTSLDSFEFVPDLPLAHVAGAAEQYLFSMNPGANGATDLAGNPLETVLPEVGITLWTGGEAMVNGGRASRFTSYDEDLEIADPNEAAFPYAEWAGEITFNIDLGIIRPRPVSRFMGVVSREPVDSGNAISGDITVGAMPINANLFTSPLSQFGAKTQFLWRFMDVGFNLIERGPGLDIDDITDDFYAPDPSSYNLDVEGLWWVPKTGTANVDSYGLFEMRMSHGFFMPDEAISLVPIAVISPNSGLVPTFSDNQLSGPEDPQRIVHTKDLGYVVSPGEMIGVGTSTNLMPWPMNRTIPPSQKRYYTWRDTGLRTRGGPSNIGIDGLRWFENNPEVALPLQPDITVGSEVCDDPMAPPIFHPFYSPEQIQSIGLPLLVEVRCFSDLGASGVNLFDTNVAPPPAYTGLQPYFRAFSSGGFPSGTDEALIVNPEFEDLANGGFDPSSVPPGAPTPGLDNTVYLGALDFVVRTSQSHSVWWEVLDADGQTTTSGLINNPTFNPPTLEPRPELLPTGTSIEVSFRGATGVDASTPGAEQEPAFQVRQAATMLDRYGDHYVDNSSICDNSIDHDAFSLLGVQQINTPIGFIGGSDSWKDDVSQINGSSYYQVRLTFISNAESGISPYLSAIGLTWQQ